MNNKEMLAKTSDLILGNIGRATFTDEEIAYAKGLYEEVLASVPERLLPWVNPIMTGTEESKREYIANHHAWSQVDPSRQEMMVYSELASSIAHLIDGTLGLRD
jgi:hypothetical protein